MFLTGNLQGQVGWTRHLVKLSAEKLREGEVRPEALKELIPEVVNHSANILYILGGQFDSLSEKLRKSVNPKSGADNWTWRIYFEEFFLTRLLQTYDYDEPISGSKLTLGEFGEIADEFADFPSSVRDEYNSLLTSIGEDSFPGYAFIRKVFEETRLAANRDLHRETIQKLVDSKFLPVIRKSLLEGDYPFWTRPTVYINFRRTLDKVSTFFGYRLLLTGLIGLGILSTVLSIYSTIPFALVIANLLIWKIIYDTKDKIARLRLSEEEYKEWQFMKNMQPIGYFDGIIDQIINTLNSEPSDEVKSTWDPKVKAKDDFGIGCKWRGLLIKYRAQ